MQIQQMKPQQPQRRLYSLTAVLTLLFLALPTTNNLQYDGSVAVGHGQRGGGGMVAATSATTGEKPSVNNNPYSILNRVAVAYSGQSTPHSSVGTGSHQKLTAAESKAGRIKKRSASEVDAKEAQQQKKLFSAYEAIVNSESQIPMFLHQRKQPTKKHAQTPAKQAATAVAAAKTNSSEKLKKQDNQKNATQKKKVKGGNKKKGNASSTEKTALPDASWDRPQRKIRSEQEPTVAAVEEAPTLKTLFDNVFGGPNAETADAKAVEEELKEDSSHTKDPIIPASVGEHIVEDLSKLMNVESVTDAKAAVEALAAAAKEMYHHPQPESGAVHHAIEHLTEAVAAAAAAAESAVSTLTEKAQEGLAAPMSSHPEESKEANESVASTDKKGTVVINDQEYEHHHAEHEEEDRVGVYDTDNQRQQYYPHQKGHALQDSNDFLAHYMHRADPMATFWKRVLTTSAIVLSAFMGILLVISYKMYRRNLRLEARFGDESNGTVATSPLAFFHYITLGIFAWPAAFSSSIQFPSPSSLSRSGSGTSSSAASATTKVRRRSSLGLLVGGSEKSLLPEPVVAKSSSSAAVNSGGGPMPAIRRTSASIHMPHLEQTQEQFQNQNQGYSS
ncbi:hypothetical protein EMPS_04981 [Entomortierella parvispora]|uniref:Transmembrane protein n=1 Tax=Entomortierella parvispora TaxID=205924 RepID=A0A9P3LW08_9FUNG|nr:hypothetical protein EMPS_04981 [Entomortierella parvispora]